MQPLFKPIVKSEDENANENLTNSGNQNEYFSSTRLVPVSADINYPYRTVGKLFFTIPGKGDYVCSASVINYHTIVTAGHCVFSGVKNSAYYTNFLFIPAFRDGTAPYQTWSAGNPQASDSWKNGGGVLPNSADFALLNVGEQIVNGIQKSLGDVVGFLGWQTESLMPNHVTMLGYPCNFDSCQKMHQVNAQSAASISPNNVEYGSDMGSGSDGAPWVQNFGLASNGQTGGKSPAMNKVVGVTSWGYMDTSYMAQGASIFNEEFDDLVRKWGG